jgi:hypothetical protein
VPTAATLPPGTQLPKLRRRRSRSIAPMTWFFVALAAVIVLAVGLSFSMGDDSNTASGATPGPVAVTSPPLTVPIVDTPSRPRRSVTIKVPEGARVRIGNDSVSLGSWTTDTLAPGTYNVVASVPGRTGCPFATSQRTIRVRDTGVDTFPLYPSDCGTIVLEPKYNGKAGQGRYVISALGWKEEKLLPRKGPVTVTVPAGVVQVLMRAQYCTDFKDSFRIAPGATTRIPRTLICGNDG